MFNTLGRRAVRSYSTGGHSSVYPMLVFRRGDIKDIHFGGNTNAQAAWVRVCLWNVCATRVCIAYCSPAGVLPYTTHCAGYSHDLPALLIYLWPHYGGKLYTLARTMVVINIPLACHLQGSYDADHGPNDAQHYVAQAHSEHRQAPARQQAAMHTDSAQKVS